MASTKDLVTKKYDFITGQVPRYDVSDPEGLNLVKNQLPVILTGSDLVAPAMKWDLEYLTRHIGTPGSTFSVFINSASSSPSAASLNNNSNEISTEDPMSEADDDDECESVAQAKKSKCSTKCTTTTTKRHHLFKYYDTKKAEYYKGHFHTDIARKEMTFDEFLKRFHGDRDKERVYFQQPLNNTVGKQIAADFVQFNWSWTVKMANEWSWGPLTSNLLLIGQQGNVTPCHYDEQQNLFCQLHGQKRFFLFPPENFPYLYPYPVHHPNDRQSQVDFEQPNLELHPKFRMASGVEAILNPGEILYLPMYYWHHVINTKDTVAINFWHKGGANTSPIEYPLKSHQKVAMVRNIEKLTYQALQEDENELSNILHWLVDGRF